MRFYKINGAGNDFIVINNIEENIPAGQFPILAKTLCTRRMSIGADGLMVVEKSEIADIKMDFYNCDGSIGEMCGNGARCICRFAFEAGLSGGEQTVETCSGVITGNRLTKQQYRIEMTKPTCINTSCEVTALGKKIQCSYIELGDPPLPHAVVYMPDVNSVPVGELFELGKAIRENEAFPFGANVNFYDITGEDEVYIRTFERGVEDFTYACGSGTCSTALSLYLKGELKSGRLIANMRGGRLEVEVMQSGGEYSLYLTGPTNIVAFGEVLDEALENIK